METLHPVLQLADGTRLVGRFEETVGTQLILADAVQQGGDGSHSVRLVGHTDKRITFAAAAAAAGPVPLAGGVVTQQLPQQQQQPQAPT